MINIYYEDPLMTGGTLLDLMHAHGKEVVGPKFNLNIGVLARLAETGKLKLFVARDSDMQAVGYALFTLYADFMNAQVYTADCQAIYVKPEYRGRVSIRLITEAEKHLKAFGVGKIYMHLPNASKAVNLFPRLKYTSLEQVYFKEI